MNRRYVKTIQKYMCSLGYNYLHLLIHQLRIKPLPNLLNTSRIRRLWFRVQAKQDTVLPHHFLLFLHSPGWEDGNLRDRGCRWRDVLANEPVAGETENESPHPGESVEMEGTRRDNEVGVDALREAREDRTDGNEEDEPSAPVPSVVVTVFSVRIVHVADIQFHVADKVVIRD